MNLLNEIMEQLDALTPEARRSVIEESQRLTDKLWVPNPGPQFEAYHSDADEVFYGGSAGGGKTDLALGLSLNEHKRCLILREYLDDTREMAERMLEILGHRAGWNGQLNQYRNEDQIIRFAGCSRDSEKQRFKGKPYDLYVFDEVSDFLESVYIFITGWNRSATPGQRCRVLACGNPPTKPEGLWVVKRWAAWLDPRHPKPAKPGELRWYIRGQDDKDIEVEGPGEYSIDVDGKELKKKARSRTFIRAWLSDNPDLMATDYDATLSNLPEYLRKAYQDGRFDEAIEEHPEQCIPTSWVMAAIDRRKKRPEVPMCAVGVDCTGGSKDPMILAPRYDGWYEDLVEIPGKNIPMESAGATAAGYILANRRDNALIIIDMGGGYGGPSYEHLANNLDTSVLFAYKGSESTAKKCKVFQMGFSNVRTGAYSLFRNALDPSQPGGSPICLPDDPELIAELTAPRRKVVKGNFVLERKEDVVERLGRSTNKADAVVMAWWEGKKMSNSALDWLKRKHPQVKIGRTPLTARRRR